MISQDRIKGIRDAICIYETNDEYGIVYIAKLGIDGKVYEWALHQISAITQIKLLRKGSSCFPRKMHDLGFDHAYRMHSSCIIIESFGNDR
jgi:hypothetical protein